VLMAGNLGALDDDNDFFFFFFSADPEYGESAYRVRVGSPKSNAS